MASKLSSSGGSPIQLLTIAIISLVACSALGQTSTDIIDDIHHNHHQPNHQSHREEANGTQPDRLNINDQKQQQEPAPFRQRSARSHSSASSLTSKIKQSGLIDTGLDGGHPQQRGASMLASSSSISRDDDFFQNQEIAAQLAATGSGTAASSPAYLESGASAPSSRHLNPAASEYLAGYHPYPSAGSDTYERAYQNSIHPHSSHYNNNHYNHHHGAPFNPPPGYPDHARSQVAPSPAHYFGPEIGSFAANSHSHSLPASGLISSASHALSHWTGGFGIAEIVCSLVAVAIGAIILGAPFFLIYLVLMGNFSGSGQISLANPTGAPTTPAAATVAPAGRRKRSVADMRQTLVNQLAQARAHTNNIINNTTNNNNNNRVTFPPLPDLAKFTLDKLSPLVDPLKLAETYGKLVKSFARFSPLSQNYHEFK